MKNRIYALYVFFICFLSIFGYAESDDKNKYYINPDDLRLISGKMFLVVDNSYVPLKNITYSEDGIIAEMEAAFLLPCTECGGWYILGFQHNCNGKMK